MKVNKKKFKLILIMTVLLIVALLIVFLKLHFTDLYSVSKFISIYTLINLIIIEICLIRYEKIISFYQMFVILCFLFLFGQCYAIALFNNLGQSSIFSISSVQFSVNLIFKSSMFVLISILMMTLGYIFFINIFNSENNRKNDSSFKNKKIIKNIGWIILIVTIIPTMYLCYKDVVALNIYGYEATLMEPTGVDKLLNIFKGLLQASFIILILSESNERKKICYVLLCIYLLAELAGGSRIQAFRFLIIILMIYFKSHKVNIKRLSLGVIGVYIIAVFFSFISASRSASISFANFGDYLNAFDKNGIFYNILMECGHTQTLISVVFLKCPQIVNYQYGLSFFRAILSAIPNVGLWDVHPAMMTVDKVFSPLYINRRGFGLGSSIFAVMYWNFGIAIGTIAMGFFGVIIAKIVNYTYKSNDFTKEFIGYYLLFFISFLVRSDIEQFGRSFIFYCAFPLLLIKIFTKSNKDKN